jgi:hypothetical protein
MIRCHHHGALFISTLDLFKWDRCWYYNTRFVVYVSSLMHSYTVMEKGRQLLTYLTNGCIESLSRKSWSFSTLEMSTGNWQSTMYIQIVQFHNEIEKCIQKYFHKWNETERMLVHLSINLHFYMQHNNYYMLLWCQTVRRECDEFSRYWVFSHEVKHPRNPEELANVTLILVSGGRLNVA